MKTHLPPAPINAHTDSAGRLGMLVPPGCEANRPLVTALFFIGLLLLVMVRLPGHSGESVVVPALVAVAGVNLQITDRASNLGLRRVEERGLDCDE